MTRILFIAAVAAVGLGMAGQAPVRAEPATPDRYELKPVEGGFLRLDRQTGLTAICRPSGEGYACRAAEEGKSAEAAMAAALEKRIAELEAKVKALEAAPAAPKDGASKDGKTGSSLEFPTDEQLDRAASFLERALQRLKKLAEEAPKDGDQKL